MDDQYQQVVRELFKKNLNDGTVKSKKDVFSFLRKWKVADSQLLENEFLVALEAVNRVILPSTSGTSTTSNSKNKRGFEDDEGSNPKRLKSIELDNYHPMTLRSSKGKGSKKQPYPKQSRQSKQKTNDTGNDTTAGSNYERMDMVERNAEGGQPHLAEMGDQLIPNKKYPFSHDPSKVTITKRSYLLKKIRQRRYRSYDAIDTTYRVKFQREMMGDNLVDILDNLYSMFENLLIRARRNTPVAPEDDRFVRVIVRHDDLKTPIVVPSTNLDKIDAGVILEKIQHTLNSNETLAIDESFSVSIGTIRKLGGHGRLNPTSIENIKRKKSIINIENTDKICLQRAIAVAWANFVKISNEEWQDIKLKYPPKTSNLSIIEIEKKCSTTYYKDALKKSRNEQLKITKLVASWANVPIDRPGTLDDIPHYENALDLHICVVSRENGNKFVTPIKNGKPKLYLYHNANHFDTILTPTGFFNSSYFCTGCLQPFEDFKNHCCHNCCRVCHSTDCIADSYVDCPDCNMTCRSQDCFIRHKSPKHDFCRRFWKCLDCKKILSTEKRSQSDHFCSERICASCKQYVPHDHLCYMMALQPVETKLRLMVFDFECRQDDEIECEFGYTPKNPTGLHCVECENESTRCKTCLTCTNCNDMKCGRDKHTPNLVISQTVCDLCRDNLDTDFETTCSNCGSRCESCSIMNKEKNFKMSPCKDKCGQRVMKFMGDGCAGEFGKWLFRDYHHDFVVIAHYFKGYDGYFILNFLLQNGMTPDRIIYSGSKIMGLLIKRGMNITFTDSYNFFQLKLTALPKAFGFPNLVKGFFAHFFNRLENQNYVGKYPCKEDFGLAFMSEEVKIEFEKWYSEIPDDAVYDFKKEIVKYCKCDTDILLYAVMRFRDQMIKIFNVDPLRYHTIASYCLAAFKTRYLPEDWLVDIKSACGRMIAADQTVTIKNQKCIWEGEELDMKRIKKKKFLSSPIAHVPSSGYTSRDQYSLQSICYLEWLSLKRNRQIQHALNLGEKKIKIGRSWYRADGFLPDLSGRTKGHVIEFHGCHQHGCPRCLPSQRDSLRLCFSSETIEEKYAATMRKKNDLIINGFTYECFWGCEYDSLLKKDEQFKNFVTNLIKSKDLTPRLELRDAFTGGRTGATKLFYEAAADEEIHYYDFTSLYPYVNKYAKYPKGHPKIITSDFSDINDYFGFAKIRILAPTNLYHPVLPTKINGKLKFALCAKCAEEEYSYLCTCSDEERAFVGTWTTIEIHKAIEKGYTLIKIYEVYHFDEYLLYDAERDEGGLFAEYMNTLLKLKQEASGWPSECIDNDAKKEKYLADFLERENITLDPNNVVKNAPLRWTSKSAANSSWGKYGQRLKLKQTKFFNASQAEMFFQFVTDPTKEIINFHIINEDVIQLEYTDKDHFVPENTSTNIFIAIVTTSYARVKLLDLLYFLDGEAGRTDPPEPCGPLNQLKPALHYPTRVLYYDTDSVIFVTKKGQPNPPLGNFIGDLTDEAPGEKIVKFISAGPKVYAYKTSEGKEVCKIRGFTLNFENKKIINMDSLEQIIRNWASHGITLTTHNNNNLIRDKQTCNIITVTEKKDFKMVFTKRAIKSDFDTVPYGYRG